MVAGRQLQVLLQVGRAGEDGPPVFFQICGVRQSLKFVLIPYYHELSRVLNQGIQAPARAPRPQDFLSGAPCWRPGPVWLGIWLAAEVAENLFR